MTLYTFHQPQRGPRQEAGHPDGLGVPALDREVVQRPHHLAVRQARRPNVDAEARVQLHPLPGTEPPIGLQLLLPAIPEPGPYDALEPPRGAIGEHHDGPPGLPPYPLRVHEVEPADDRARHHQEPDVLPGELPVEVQDGVGRVVAPNGRKREGRAVYQQVLPHDDPGENRLGWAAQPEGLGYPQAPHSLLSQRGPRGAAQPLSPPRTT